MSCQPEPWGLEFSREEIEEARCRNRILTLELELSHICNLRCLYCYSAAGIPLPDELSIAEVKDAVDQAVGCGARRIIVLGGGEPLLYPHLLEVVDHILAKGAKADLFTNGLLMTPELAQALYERGVAVAIKMNSRVPEVQDYLAGRGGAFVAMQKGLAALRAAGYPDEGHKLGVGTIICRQNIEEIPDIWLWAKKEGIVPYVETMTWQGRAIEYPNLKVTGFEVKALFERLARIDAEHFGLHWTPHPPFAASQCARHEYSCTITATGDIYPCPGVNLSVGNIRKAPLGAILAQSPVLQNLRNIRERIEGQCRDCEMLERCYGCRGHAYQVSGNYLASDPLCWHSPVAAACS